MERRSFLKVLGSAAGGCAFGITSAWARESTVPLTDTVLGMPRRMLGRTGRQVSIIGFPGLAMTRDDQATCNRALQQAVDLGVNYVDNAPAYGNGVCEERMGVALQGVDRDGLFLACKTKMRDARGCREELERSLERHKTDHFDLYQLHHLRQPSEVEQALGPGGAMEAILKAREEGKLRWIGFSAHTTKAAVLALNRFPFDTVMFPINYVEMFTIGFGREVLETAQAKGAAVLAIKPMSAGTWPEGMERTRQWWYRTIEEQDDVNRAIRFSLSQRGVVTGFSPAWLDLVEKSIAAGKVFQPVSPEDIEILRERAHDAASVFKREEDQVAGFRPLRGPVYPDSPHEAAPTSYA
ncbi:MAG: aldo/keto reductase [Verrucomicrobiales bacterium]|nr:aldo/keto reductase [Verrucomicrobiales bacterium]MCP5525713.1 aldo/keto reductase [Verrucomicrobiales bacterium]